MRLVTRGTSTLRRDSVELARPLGRAGCGARGRRRGGRPRRPAGPPRGLPRPSSRPPAAGSRERSNSVKSPIRPLRPSNRPSSSCEHPERRRARAQQRPCARRRRWPAAPAADGPNEVAAEPDAAAEGVRPERGEPPAVLHVAAQPPLEPPAAARRALPANATPGALPSAGPSPRASDEVGGEVVGEPLAVEEAQQRRALGAEARGQAAAGERAVEPERRAAGKRVGEAVEVVVDGVEALPGERRQHHERPRAGRRALGLRQAGHGERPDRAPVVRPARAPGRRRCASVAAPARGTSADALAAHAPGSATPRRESTKSKERSKGPTSRRATAPAGTAASGPRA